MSVIWPCLVCISSQYSFLILSCRSIIVQARADVTMIRDNHDGTFSRIPAYFYTSTRIVNRAQEFDIESVLAEFNFKVQQFNRRGSGFELERIVRFVLVINTYRPLHGSTYLPTPDWLVRKHCIINVNNKQDNKCFIWSILAALYPAPDRNTSLLSHYVKHQSAVNMAGLDYPVSTKQIPILRTTTPKFQLMCSPSTKTRNRFASNISALTEPVYITSTFCYWKIRPIRPSVTTHMSKICPHSCHTGRNTMERRTSAIRVCIHSKNKRH